MSSGPLATKRCESGPWRNLGSIDNSYGYALLIRRGLVAWMRAWPRPAQEPPRDPGSGSRVDPLTVPSHLLQSAASLLVNMILFLGTPTEVPHEQ